MDANSSQPIISEDSPDLTVNVKLLTNQSYEFRLNRNTPVLEFKNQIAQKVSVPVERQRLVFGGKQLLDDHQIGQYVKESGCTVHLIAKSTNAEQPPQPPQQLPQQPPQPPQQQPPQQANFMNSFSNILGSISTRIQQSQPGEEMRLDLGSMFQNLAEVTGINPPPPWVPSSLNIRMPASQSQPNQSFVSAHFQVPQPQVPQPQVPQPQVSQPQVAQPQVNMNQIQALNNSINLLNLPPDTQSQSSENFREQTALFLRRLQHQMLRVIPNLNRGIQLLNEGRISHLSGFIQVFRDLNQANNIASQAIRRLLQEAPPQPQQNIQISMVMQSGVQNGSGQQLRSPLVMSSPVINPRQVNTSPTNISQANQQVQMQVEQPQPQQQSPLAGLNMGNIFSMMNEMGGMQSILSIPLGHALEGMSSPSSKIYTILLDSFTGSDFLGCVMQRNFSFLNDKKVLIRENIGKAIAEAGSRSAFLAILEKDFAQLILPKGNIPRDCGEAVARILSRRLDQLLTVFTSIEQDGYADRVAESMKILLFESLDEVVKFSEGQDATLQAFKRNLLNQLSQGLPMLPMPLLSGAFSSLFDMSITKNYKDYLAEKKRRLERSAAETRTEQELLKRIGEQAEKDIEYLESFKHSGLYAPK